MSDDLLIIGDGERLHASYVFSWNSTLPEAKGARAMFEAVCVISLRHGKIAEYREVVSAVFARQGAALKARAETQRRLPDG